MAGVAHQGAHFGRRDVYRVGLPQRFAIYGVGHVVSVFLFGIRLSGRCGVLKGGQLFAGSNDAHDGWQFVERAVEAAGVEDLRDQAAISDSRRFSVTKTAGARITGQQFLDRGQADIGPVAIPVIFLFLRDPEFLAEVLQYPQIIERVDVAGDGLRQRPDPAPDLLPWLATGPVAGGFLRGIR